MPGNTSGAKSKIGKENFTVLLPTSLLKAQVLDDAARLAEQLRRGDVEASRLQREAESAWWRVARLRDEERPPDERTRNHRR